MEQVRRGYSFCHYKHKFFIPQEYEFKGGGAYGEDVKNIIDDTDRDRLVEEISCIINTPPILVNDWNEIPQPKNKLYQAAGLKTQAAFDKAKASIAMEIYSDRTMIYFRPNWISPRKGYTEEVKLESTDPKSIVEWLLRNKKLYTNDV